MQHMRPPRVPASEGSVRPIRAMVVDDSSIIRNLVTRWLNEAPGIIVVSSQRNGAGALRDLEASRPDVVVLDVEMPEMDGITALPKLLEMRPDLAVIMASGLTKRNADISLRSLELGARDYVPKPEGTGDDGGVAEFQRELIEKIRLYAPEQQANPVHPAPPVPAIALKTPGSATYQLRPFNKVRPRVLAIGSSTGGPQALYRLLESVKDEIREVPVLVTQHMPPNFTVILANHLGKVTGCPALEGTHGEVLKAGTIYVAPGDKHMLVETKGGQPAIAISDAPPVNFCKPAVDPMFESVTGVYGGSVLGVVLTGMGRDGADGALAIANAGGNVLAQDEASSVVWGMPGATARAGACAGVLALEEMGATIARILRGQMR